MNTEYETHTRVYESNPELLALGWVGDVVGGENPAEIGDFRENIGVALILITDLFPDSCLEGTKESIRALAAIRYLQAYVDNDKEFVTTLKTVIELIEGAEWEPEDHWEDHPDVVLGATGWRYEVANQDTRLGYVQWVNSKLAEREDDAELAR